jgi:LysR family hydrogen peroxide-inducible transcriptional activator
MLPRLLPQLQKTHPALRLEVRETQTAELVYALSAGELDCLLVALPIKGLEIETLALFEDRFMFAASASECLPTRRLTVDDVDPRRVILLEEGHCLRDQAIAFCKAGWRDAPAALGSTSLATVMQMVANGYGVTLLPEIAANTEARDARVKLARFAEPEPGRTIGLVWRRTSPRQKDFEALGDIVRMSIKPE